MNKLMTFLINTIFIYLKDNIWSDLVLSKYNCKITARPMLYAKISVATELLYCEVCYFVTSIDSPILIKISITWRS